MQNDAPYPPWYTPPPYHPPPPYFTMYPQPQFYVPYPQPAFYAAPPRGPHFQMPHSGPGYYQPTHAFQSTTQAPQQPQQSHQFTPMQHNNYGQTNHYNGQVNYYVPHSRAKKSDFRPTPAKTKASTHASSAVVFETPLEGQIRTRNHPQDDQNQSPPRKKQKADNVKNKVPSEQEHTLRPECKQNSTSPTLVSTARNVANTEGLDQSRSEDTAPMKISLRDVLRSATVSPQACVTENAEDLDQPPSKETTPTKISLRGVSRSATVSPQAYITENIEDLDQSPSKETTSMDTSFGGDSRSATVDSQACITENIEDLDQSPSKETTSMDTSFGGDLRSATVDSQACITENIENLAQSPSERAASVTTELPDEPYFPAECSLSTRVSVLAEWLRKAYPNGVDLDIDETIKADQINMLSVGGWYDDCILLHIAKCLEPLLKQHEEIFIPGYLDKHIRPNTTVVYYLHLHNGNHWILVKAGLLSGCPTITFYDGRRTKFDHKIVAHKILETLNKACNRQRGAKNPWESSFPIIHYEQCDRQTDSDSCGPRVITIIEHMLRNCFTPHKKLVNKKMRRHHFDMLLKAITSRPDQKLQAAKNKALRVPSLPGLGDTVIDMCSYDDEGISKSDIGNVYPSDTVNPALLHFTSADMATESNLKQGWTLSHHSDGTFSGFSPTLPSEDQNSRSTTISDAISDVTSNIEGFESCSSQDDESQEAHSSDSSSESSSDSSSESSSDSGSDMEDSSSDVDDSASDGWEDDDPENVYSSAPMPQIPPVPEYDPDDNDYDPTQQVEVPTSRRRSHRLLEKNKQQAFVDQPTRSTAKLASPKPAAGGRVPCPLAAEYDCTKTYSKSRNARRHAKTHCSDRERFPCPLAAEYDCTKTFASAGAAKLHAETHCSDRERFPCSVAEEYDCTKTFANARAAKVHAETHCSDRERFPCPLAEEYDCTKTFASAAVAKVHAETHCSDRERFPCPVAAEYNCTKTFSSVGRAKVHAETHCSDRERFPCPFAKLYNCKKTFSTQHGAEDHAKRHGALLHSEAKYACGNCRALFRTEKKRDRHQIACQSAAVTITDLPAKGPDIEETTVADDVVKVLIPPIQTEATTINGTGTSDFIAGLFTLHATSPTIYQHEGVNFQLSKDLSQLTSLPKDWCPTQHNIVQWELLFWHRLLHALPAVLNSEWKFYLDCFEQNTIKNAETGCAWTDFRVSFPRHDNGLNRCACGCGNILRKKKFGGGGVRVQYASQAIQYAIKKDWLGLAKVLFGIDSKNHARLQVSHHCAPLTKHGYTMNCWTIDHASSETAVQNAERKSHHSGARPCNDTEDGRPPCIGAKVRFATKVESSGPDKQGDI